MVIFEFPVETTHNFAFEICYSFEDPNHFTCMAPAVFCWNTSQGCAIFESAFPGCVF